MSSDLVAAIDKAVRDDHEKANMFGQERRGHLGASVIGNRCARAVWYGFRWAYQERHLGRILRLFSRGHEEEPRFARWLRMAGAEVQDYSQRLCYYSGPEGSEYRCVDWNDPVPAYFEDVSQDPHHIAIATDQGVGPKQWNFVDHDDHFSGSSDGRIRAGEGCTLKLPDGWGLLEEKTHSDKSFKQLTAKGVLSSKPTHYVQMQIYMHYFGLPWALYMAVNKNDDTLYCELLWYKEEVAMGYVAAASKLIEARTAPARLTKDPSWFECKFCAYRDICHYNEVPQKNCRSCAFASAAADGGWHCNKFNGELPKDFIPKGCEQWEPIE